MNDEIVPEGGEPQAGDGAEETMFWPKRPRPVPPLWRTGSFFTGMIAGLVVPAAVLVALLGLFISLRDGFLPDWEGVVGVAVALAFGLGMGWAAISERRRINAEVQASRDRFAVKVAALLEAGYEPPPYSLYLRPFFTDGELTDEAGGTFMRVTSLDAEEIADIGQKRDLERAAARALEAHAPLISLGRPNDRLGAGRIETHDDNWKALFEKLIAHARRVIMVPIGQPATMEEVRTIATTPDLLAKTVFVLPADRKKKDFTFAPDPTLNSIGQMWNWTRDQVADVLPAFPRFRGGPRLVTFPSPDEAVEFAGNGIMSVQQTAGIKKFLVEGRAQISRFVLPVTLILALAFALIGSVPLQFKSSWDLMLDPDPATARSLVGFEFLLNFTVLPLLLLSLVKIVTDEMPKRLGMPVILAMMSFNVLSLYGLILREFPEAIEGFYLSLGADETLAGLLSFFPLRLIGNSVILMLSYVAVRFILGRNIEWRHLGIIALAWAVVWVILLMWFYGIAGQQGEASDRYPAMQFIIGKLGLVPTLLALTLAVLPAASRRLALIAIGAALLFVVGQRVLSVFLIAPFLFERELEFIRMGRDAEALLSFAWQNQLISLAVSIGSASLIVGYAYVMRRVLGLGAERQWKYPLPEYP